MAKFKPTPEQQYIINEVIDKQLSALVVAGPGTGKSRTAIEAAVNVIDGFSSNSTQQVIFLSFSNAAIQRLASSAGIHFNRKQKHNLCFMTYHSCAAEIVRNYGRFVGLPNKTRIIDKLEERLIAIENGWDHSGQTHFYSFMELARKEGMLAFDVLIPLATKLLFKSQVISDIVARRFPLIIVDEFQDTSFQQWQFLKSIGKSSQVLAFADPNQIIYSSLHAATEQRISEFKEWKGIEISNFSNDNFRCEGRGILELADALLYGKKYTLQEEWAVKIVNARYRNKLRPYLALIWKSIYNQVGPNQTIAFLSPSNAIAEQIATSLRNPPGGSTVPIPVYVKLARDEAAYDSAILALAALRDMVTNPKELTAKKAAVALLAMRISWGGGTRSGQKEIVQISKWLLGYCSKWHGGVGQFLQELRDTASLKETMKSFAECFSGIDGFKRVGKRLLAHGTLNAPSDNIQNEELPLFDSIRSSRKQKGLNGYEAFEGHTHVLTYHKSKGREFDFVIMVVDPRGESQKVPLEEKRRLYYVSTTRAKKWLAIIHFGQDCGTVLGNVLGQ